MPCIEATSKRRNVSAESPYQRTTRGWNPWQLRPRFAVPRETEPVNASWLNWLRRCWRKDCSSCWSTITASPPLGNNQLKRCRLLLRTVQCRGSPACAQPRNSDALPVRFHLLQLQGWRRPELGCHERGLHTGGMGSARSDGGYGPGSSGDQRFPAKE